MAARQFDGSFQGLNQILESNKWPVAQACQAVERCLEANRDNLRGFFENCFSLLLKRIFGYDGSSWLSMIAKGGKEADVKALVELLSPNSKLFAAIYSADADDLIKFMFPLERLPTHTQMLLSQEVGRRELNRWPQYQGRIVVDAFGRCQVHLNVFEYYMFWTAFYVLRGSQSQADYTPSKARYGHLPPALSDSVRKAGSALRLTRVAQAAEYGHPYLRLLARYLEHFLSRPLAVCAAHAAAAGPPAALAMQPRGAAGGRGEPGASSRGQVYLSSLVEFWLTDSDEPLPVALPGSSTSTTPSGSPQGPAYQAAPAAPIRAAAYEPPSEDLLEALGALIRYLTAVEDPADRRRRVKPAQGAVAWLPLVPIYTPTPHSQHARGGGGVAGPPVGPPRLGAAGQAPFQAIARRLYRFFRRSFAQWPEQRMATPVVDLWLSFIAPWWAGALADPAAAAWRAAPSPAAGHQLTQRLSHVSELVHSALGDGHGLASRPSSAAADQGEGQFTLADWQAHVLATVPFYTLLLPAFLDLMAARAAIRPDVALADVIKVLMVFKAAPELTDLLRAAEAGYNALTSQPPRRPEGSIAEVIPFLVEQAADFEAAALASAGGLVAPPDQPDMAMFGRGEGGAAFAARELLAIAQDARARPELLEEARALAGEVLPLGQLASAEAHAPAPAAPAERIVGVRRGQWQDVQYRGDWMRRPIGSNEIGPLVRLLVRLSEAINARLGLDQPLCADDSPPENVLQQLGQWLRRRGWRVNLRPLAEYQTLAWLAAAYFLTGYLLRFLAAVWQVLTEPLEEEGAGQTRQQQHQHHQQTQPSHAHHYHQQHAPASSVSS